MVRVKVSSTVLYLGRVLLCVLEGADLVLELGHLRRVALVGERVERVGGAKVGAVEVLEVLERVPYGPFLRVGQGGRR